MDLNKLIQKFWSEIFPEGVVYISTYIMKRQKNYPGVSFKWFADPFTAKVWKTQELKRIQRKEYNDGVLARYRESLNPGPKGA